MYACGDYLVGRCAAYHLCRVAADNLGNERRRGTAMRIYHDFRFTHKRWFALCGERKVCQMSDCEKNMAKGVARGKIFVYLQAELRQNLYFI